MGKVVLWVVYKATLPARHGDPAGVNAVCPQAEWDAMELARPGYHALVREGITSEAEAEKLARGTSGDARPRAPLTSPLPKS
jgi:hypothetical protein